MITEDTKLTELECAIDNLSGLMEDVYFHIQMRGRELYRQNKVTIQTFSENPTFEVKSQSSKKNAYQVTFNDLLEDTGAITATCNCPYAQNHLICKHIVAAYLNFRDHAWKNIREGSTAFPGSDINSLKDMEQIRARALRKLAVNDSDYSKGVGQFEESSDHIKLKQVQNGHIELYIFPPTQTTTAKVTLSRAKKGITAKCQCSRTTAKSLCWHTIAALLYTRKNYSPDFFNFDAEGFQNMQQTKDELVQQYGFSIDDDLTGLFEFDVRDGQVEMQLLDPSLRPVSQYYDWQNYTQTLTPQKELPAALKDQQQKVDQFGVGFGLYLPKCWEKGNNFFHYRTDYLPDFAIIPLRGKLKKKKHEFTSRIQSISIDEVMSHLTELTPDKMKQLQEINSLSFNGIRNIIAVHDKEGNAPILDQIIPPESIPEEQLNKVFDDIRIKLLKTIPFLAEQYTILTDDWEKFTNRNISTVTISKTPAKVFFQLMEDARFLRVQMGLHLGEHRITPDEPAFNEVLFASYWWVLYQNTLYPLASLEDIKAIYQFEHNVEMKVHKNDFSGFFENFVEPLTQKFPVEMNLNREIKEVNTNNPELKVYLKELDNFLIFQPAVNYNGTEVELTGGDAFWQQSDEALIKINRKQEQEQFLEDTLRSLHPNFQKQLNNDYFYLAAGDFMKDHWFLDAFQMLRDNGIEVYGQNELKNLKFNTHKPSVSMNMSSGIDWFDVEMEVTFGDQTVRPKDVRKALQKGQNYVQLGDGTYGVLPQAWLKKYENLFRYGNIKKDKIAFPKTHFNLLDDLYEEIDNTAVAEEIAEKKRKLKDFRKLEQKPIPKGIQAELRDYQKEGFYWLNFLDEFQWGGCLADDMGLGKTLQVLTFLQYKKEQGETKPSLIVVPTTLIFNWENEIQKFAPEFTYFVNWGTSRIRSQEAFNDYDLIIASYDIIKNDIELFSEFQFHYVILDEAQAIKNPKSQRFKAVTLLKADNRLTLTGTPLENNTFDLYSQMSFLNPGLLGSQENFKSEFATPIDKNKDPEQSQKLRKLVHPFILRRKKEEVEQELPEKTVDVLYCEMDAKQKKVYDAFKNDFRDKILKKVDQEGINNSQFYILQGLLKLRQICDSPALLNEEADYGNHSTKLNELLSHVTEKTGQHKLLIFSQFVGMLRMIRQELENSEIDFEYLDGQTKNRQEKVERFQNDANCRVFLISLKAGGTGLNLTEADYVYIVDPWWNPAVEEQAIDRTHRIGQTKHIFGYKMICKDTIEERVIQLQQKKSELADELIGSEQGFVKNLTRDDLAELFS